MSSPSSIDQTALVAILETGIDLAFEAVPAADGGWYVDAVFNGGRRRLNAMRSRAPRTFKSLDTLAGHLSSLGARAVLIRLAV
jgi:hypothetical protein